MGTKEFNIVDKLISWMRLAKVIPFIEKDDVILDFGCGYQAYLLNHIKDKIKKGVGIDYDIRSKKIAPHVETRNLLFKDRIPDFDKSYSKIVALAVIEHLESPVVARLFREFYRVLKPGGAVILTTPTPFGKAILEFLAFRLGVISKEEVSDHKKYYNKTDLQNLAKQYRFEVEKYYSFQFGGNSLCVMRKL